MFFPGKSAHPEVVAEGAVADHPVEVAEVAVVAEVGVAGVVGVVATGA